MQREQYAEVDYVFTYPYDRSRVQIIGRFLYDVSDANTDFIATLSDPNGFFLSEEL